MKISSTAFLDGKLIPTKYAHPGVVGGKNISLPFMWTEAPKETKSFVFSIIDPHPVAKNWIHWFIIDIPSATTSFAEGASPKNLPKGSKELYNSYGSLGYGGPEPPKGSGPHPYVCTVYALNTEKLNLPENTSLAAFQKSLEGKVIASATMTGIYER